MKAFLMVLCILLFIISCADLPQILPSDDPAALASYVGCEIPFPKGKWQFVHSIEAELPGAERVLSLGLLSSPHSLALWHV